MNDIEVIKKIINKYIDPDENRVFIFGSRAIGNASKYSDYDIGIEGKRLSAKVYFDLVQSFEDSDLPYTVDIVDFNDVSEDFKKIAKKKIYKINY